MLYTAQAGDMTSNVEHGLAQSTAHGSVGRSESDTVHWWSGEDPSTRPSCCTVDSLHVHDAAKGLSPTSCMT